MEITDYKSLLAVAQQQAQPQKLLFVFLKTSLPKDANPEEAANFQNGEGGALEPVMCVDKAVNELGAFAELVAESEQMGKSWDIVLVSSIAGKKDVLPTSEEAERAMKVMMHTVENGGDLSRYMAFTRQGEPLQF